jgi:uncharacterized membrane protein YuzA (DUF378 family)
MTLKKVLNIIAFTILLIGGINWFMIGAFDINVISLIFRGYRSVGSIVMYVLIGISALWLIISGIVSNGRISFVENRSDTNGRDEYYRH